MSKWMEIYMCLHWSVINFTLLIEYSGSWHFVHCILGKDPECLWAIVNENAHFFEFWKKQEARHSCSSPANQPAISLSFLTLFWNGLSPGCLRWSWGAELFTVTAPRLLERIHMCSSTAMDRSIQFLHASSSRSLHSQSVHFFKHNQQISFSHSPSSPLILSGLWH